jgi:hypothetical protein
MDLQPGGLILQNHMPNSSLSACHFGLIEIEWDILAALGIRGTQFATFATDQRFENPMECIDELRILPAARRNRLQRSYEVCPAGYERPQLLASPGDDKTLLWR